MFYLFLVEIGCENTIYYFREQSILIAQLYFAKNCCVGYVSQIKNLDVTLSGFSVRSRNKPNEVQTHEPRLNGTLRYVGFGKIFALKVIYCISYHIEILNYFLSTIK
jgi:hypothetical protein